MFERSFLYQLVCACLVIIPPFEFSNSQGLALLRFLPARFPPLKLASFDVVKLHAWIVVNEKNKQSTQTHVFSSRQGGMF